MSTLEERRARQKELMDAAKVRRAREKKQREYDVFCKLNPDENAREAEFHRLFAGDDKELLLYFDNNKAYGPLLGITRKARWKRAKALFLCPPAIIKEIMKKKPEEAVFIHHMK